MKQQLGVYQICQGTLISRYIPDNNTRRIRLWVSGTKRDMPQIQNIPSESNEI